MIASVASIPPSLPLNGTAAADRPMTLTDEDMTVATTGPAENEVLVFDAAGKHHRRRRRGKKRRPGRDDPDAALSSSDASSPVKCSPTKQRKNQVVIRPLRAPKAPANSTQFIIDDHENCVLYQSFEAAEIYPRCHRVADESDYALSVDDARVADDARPSSGGHYHHHYGTHVDDSGEEGQPQSGFPTGEDYEYLDYGNMMPFYEKDFEVVYRSARFEEVMRLTRAELIEGHTALEQRIAELYDELRKVDPQNCLDELQRQLLRAQDENQALMKIRTKLLSGKVATSSSTTTTSSSSSGQEDDSDQCDGHQDEEESCGNEDESADSGHEDGFEDAEGAQEDCCRP
uniref:Hexamethylene bis-acetamide-inducible protein n=1 Tax=Rhipicephalus pulchellus TaxID=72859 RepID=L7M3B3_RHIPC